MAKIDHHRPIDDRVSDFLSANKMAAETPWDRAAAPTASPIHRGVGHDCILIRPDARAPIFLKFEAQDQIGMKHPSADRVAQLAGGLGIAPKALDVEVEDTGAAYEALMNGWRTAKVSDLRDPKTLSTIMAALQKLHGASPKTGLVEYDLPTRLNRLDAKLQSLPIDRPPEYDWMMLQARDALDALHSQSHPKVACHLGLVASNIMINGDQVMFTGFNQSGLSDPLHDFGILLTEAFDFEDEWKAVLEPVYGADVDRAVHRARLWGIADDLTWGQWGLVSHVEAVSSDVEFFKYASWRFMRAKMNMSATEFERRLRQTL